MSTTTLRKLLTSTKPVVRKLLQSSTGNVGNDSIVLYLQSKSFETSAIVSSQMKTVVGNYQINFERIGNGSHVVLCLPGALGFIQSDFSPQLQHFDSNQFTFVSWDPPGYGKSRPPNRDVLADIRQTLSYDGDLVHELMKKLGYRRYSVLGWNDGAITAMFMAHSFPQSIRRMVLWGANSFVSLKDRETYIRIRNIDALPEKARKSMIEMYGESLFRKTWGAWVDGFIDVYDKDGNICKNILPEISSPTLVIHGAKDTIVGFEHAEYIHKHIKDSKLHVIPEGEHNLHLTFSQEFNELIESFLLEDRPREMLMHLNSTFE